MAEETENKITLEREYIVPLRMGWHKVPEWKRATKAVKTLKEFMVKHMKVYDRDLRKIKVDVLLNNEIRFRGAKKPPAKIKVKAIKYSDGTVAVKLVNLPKHIEFQIARNVKREAEMLKKASEKTPLPVKEEKKEETKETKEKETSSKIATEQIEKAQAKQMQHTSKTSQETPKIQRKALKR